MAGVQRRDSSTKININNKTTNLEPHKKSPLTDEEICKNEIITPEDVLRLDHITKGFFTLKYKFNGLKWYNKYKLI